MSASPEDPKAAFASKEKLRRTEKELAPSPPKSLLR